MQGMHRPGLRIRSEIMHRETGHQVVACERPNGQNRAQTIRSQHQAALAAPPGHFCHEVIEGRRQKQNEQVARFDKHTGEFGTRGLKQQRPRALPAKGADAHQRKRRG
jgi:hypothetical protein